MDKEIHIGNIIKQKVEEKGMSKTEFADAIHCGRRNIYHIFKREHITNKEQLQFISHALNFDFALLQHGTKAHTKKHLVIVVATEEELHEIQSEYQVVYSHSVK